MLGGAGGWIIYERWLAAALSALIFAMILFFSAPKREKEKNKNKLLISFRDYLEALGTAVSAGQSSSEAFSSACEEVRQLYGPRSLIYKTARQIVLGHHNGISTQRMLQKAADESELDEMMIFSDMYSQILESGGDSRKIITESRMTISRKIETEQEIAITVASSRNEFLIMMMMPFLIIPSVRMFLSADINVSPAVDITVKTAAASMFVLSYFIGRKITDIKV